MKATYSPDDNKIRLYPTERLDAETFALVKEAGYKWAPRQELFVAPIWTPERAALAEELAGEIEDDDTSLIERAEVRQERFEEYSDKRAEDANREHANVQALTDNISLGQPILVGHHSEKRARKDAEKIERGIARAVKAFETSEYWTRRAAGAVATAKYKETPAVRARRIKKIEADKRKQERTTKEALQFSTAWKREPLTMEWALKISGYSHMSQCFPLADFPREAPASQYEGAMGIWSALDGNVITAEQARDICLPAYTRQLETAALWIEHYNHRLEYEKAMLGEQGASDLLKPKARPKAPPICNYQAPNGIEIERRYGRSGEKETLPQIELTKAEYAKIYTDYKGTRLVEGSHRIRVAMASSVGHTGYGMVCVFLTDSKAHPRPEAVDAPEAPPAPAPEPRTTPRTAPAAPKVDFDPAKLKRAAKAGVGVAVADQLFATPRDIAEKMADLLQVKPGDSVLEPSAGTGMLLGALGARMFPGGECAAVEINGRLAGSLRQGFPKTAVHAANFLEWNEGTFDKIIMNPPFKNADDIRHIEHAAAMLRPGGALVALCANGPRQQAAFKDTADHWEELPSGSFKAAGTGVNVALLVLRSPMP